MTTFSEALELAATANDSLNVLEATHRNHSLSLFSLFEMQHVSYGELRSSVSRLARSGFQAGGALSSAHVAQLATAVGIPDVRPAVVQSSPALAGLTSDLQRNFEAFRDSERTETDLRRLRFRAGLSVQLAVRRGFTDTQLAAGTAIQNRGASLRKVWVANFNANTPCAHCTALHGTELSLDAEFDHGGQGAPKVYAGLSGPPRHPNCRCYLVVFVVMLDTVVSLPGPPVAGQDRFMTARDVRRLPRAAYRAVVATLHIIAGKLKGVGHGKR